MGDVELVFQTGQGLFVVAQLAVEGAQLAVRLRLAAALAQLVGHHQALLEAHQRLLQVPHGPVGEGRGWGREGRGGRGTHTMGEAEDNLTNQALDSRQVQIGVNWVCNFLSLFKANATSARTSKL